MIFSEKGGMFWKAKCTVWMSRLKVSYMRYGWHSTVSPLSRFVTKSLPTELIKQIRTLWNKISVDSLLVYFGFNTLQYRRLILWVTLNSSNLHGEKKPCINHIKSNKKYQTSQPTFSSLYILSVRSHICNKIEIRCIPCKRRKASIQIISFVWQIKINCI